MALAKISLYIVLVFLFCHIIRIIPNAYEMIQSYNLGVSKRYVSQNKDVFFHRYITVSETAQYIFF